LYRSGNAYDPSKWLQCLDRHGVTHAFVVPLAGLVDAGKVARDNDTVAQVCARSDGRMIPFCTVNPGETGEALTELHRCLEVLSFRGIKLHPWLQGVSPSSPVVDQICELAGQHHVPVLFHDGTPPFSLPSQIAMLARRHPGTRFILGHLGLLEHWREAIAAMNHADNLWGCLCSPHIAAMKALVRRCDRNRLLWGSDHGFKLTDVIGYRLGLIDLLDLSDDDRDAILCRNPSRLMQ
jgi:predicted TIM-barrel fold metal-dependent hydrolase